ncbi:carboxylesterase 5A [Lingula anatina]|uniref:Carboxylic ester hydrolase n=1 Tax=Lingula anatina TaxID=7574 RepID=A0A1S3IHQ7_LINAN|nr:carboxylesterase 5A [Lingula anatina]|eukprot:XP_013397406.1 carboxylesterase 5A [Lingula anatina]
MASPLLTTFAVMVVNIVSCQVQVTTKYGVIQGRMHTIEGKTLSTFFGVPFAKPPLGNLRFKKPQAAEPLTGVLNASDFGNSCMQRVSSEFPFPKNELSEDCLTLNLYVPGDIYTNNSKAVMVWIYGGGYNAGASKKSNFTKFSVQGDVIVVSVNYRVGPFGFLTTGDVNVPGNAGLWDQIEGLKWVRDNIKHFGGDPNRVTIFGVSGGAGCVTQLSVTLAAKGLFHRFISMSGTALGDWAFGNGLEGITTKMGDILNCNASASDTPKLVACLQRVDKALLLKASLQAAANTSGFRPVVDGDMFPRPVAKMLQDTNSEVARHFRSLDYMGGFLNSDGGGLFPFFSFNYSQGIDPDFMRDVLIPDVAKSISPHHQAEIAQNIQKTYFASASGDWGATARGYVDLNTDLAGGVPTIELLSYHLALNTAGSSYLYYFTKEPSFGHLYPMPTWFRGPNHAEEMAFLLHGELSRSINITFTEYEKDLCDKMVTYWTNFAKTGDPNRPIPLTVEWKQYTKSDKHYIEFGDDIVSKMNLNPKRMELWLKTIPQILSRGTTPSPSCASGRIGTVLIPLAVFITLALTLLRIV